MTASRAPHSPVAADDPDAAPVIETTANVPVFVDGLWAIDVDRHGIARVVLTAEQREPSGGTTERIVAVRLLLPRTVMAEVAGRMLAAAAEPAPNVLPPTRSARSVN